MASTDAIPVPRKNTAYRFTFAIRKPSDSTLITTWTGMDSEVSLDGAAFADCTNEATEIGTSGCGYIDLTAAEMNADSVILKVTVTNTGAVPLVFTFLPESAGDYRVADTQKVDVETIKTNPVVNAGTITFPTTATLASTTNIAGFAAGAISEAAFATTDGSFHPLGIVDQGTAQSATSTTLVLRAGAAFANSELIGATVLITGGTTGVGQTRRITANTLSTDTVTVLAWATTPTGTITYKIFQGTDVDVRKWLGTAAATPSVAGVPEVDITHVMGVSASASGTVDANVTQWLGTAVVTPAVAGTPDVNAKQIGGNTTASDKLALSAQVIFTGTASGTPSPTSIPTSVVSPTPSAAFTDQFKGRIIIFRSDTTTVALRGQATDITSSSASTTPTFGVTALTTAPAVGDTFIIV